MDGATTLTRFDINSLFEINDQHSSEVVADTPCGARCPHCAQLNQYGMCVQGTGHEGPHDCGTCRTTW